MTMHFFSLSLLYLDLYHAVCSDLTLSTYRDGRLEPLQRRRSVYLGARRQAQERAGVAEGATWTWHRLQISSYPCNQRTAWAGRTSVIPCSGDGLAYWRRSLLRLFAICQTRTAALQQAHFARTRCVARRAGRGRTVNNARDAYLLRALARPASCIVSRRQTTYVPLSSCPLSSPPVCLSFLSLVV